MVHETKNGLAPKYQKKLDYKQPHWKWHKWEMKAAKENCEQDSPRNAQEKANIEDNKTCTESATDKWKLQKVFATM